MSSINGVGQKIKLIRKSNGMSATFVAKKLKIHSSTLNKYESGDRKVSADLLPVIAEVLGVNVGSFYSDKIDKTSNMK